MNDIHCVPKILAFAAGENCVVTPRENLPPMALAILFQPVQVADFLGDVVSRVP